MKKVIFLIACLLLVGCVNKNPYENVPDKININGVGIDDSSVTTLNIDNYLFREDSIYVDLRPYSWVIKDGHIAGFSFYPFYEMIASRKSSDARLFTMSKVELEDGSEIPGGAVGTFTPNYVESEEFINDLFPKDKYIFAISQSGLECTYFLSLLLQLGYDGCKLYNVGGFGVGTGFDNIAYTNIDNPKYLVAGNINVSNSEDINLNFNKNLTPIS